MKKDDFEYILSSIANMSAIPIRLYKKDKMVNTFSVVKFPLDPVALYIDKILSLKDTISIFNAPHFFFYGTVRTQGYQIVLGPTSYRLSETNVKNLSYDLKLPLNDYKKLKDALEMITSMPFTTFLQMLLMINFVLNHEKREISDFFDIKTQEEIKNENYNFDQDKYHYNSMDIEREILKIVRNGDLNALEAMTKNLKTLRAGTTAPNPARNMKNIFVAITTLASREAIKVGVDEEDALSACDSLIMKSELANTSEELTNLFYEAVYTFVKKVSFYKGNKSSEMANKLTTYILQNISKNITLEEIANYFYISKSSLCAKFKNEVGKTINDFILEKKIQISLDLLKDKTKSISYISEYLGFSSPPHFTKTFLKIIGETPTEYRNRISENRN